MLNYVEAAAYLTIGVAKLRKMVYAGKVTSVTLGHRTVRFRESDLDRCTVRCVRNSVFERGAHRGAGGSGKI